MEEFKKQIFYKSTFQNISKNKKKKIFEVAISEFASKGYNATNINIIAEKSKISIGSMYSYFASKEDLFLAIVDQGFQILENALNEVKAEEGDVFEIIERLFKVTREYIINYPELNQIYLDFSTQGLSNLSRKLSKKMEFITAELYIDILKRAKKEGTISLDIDERLASFYIDNLLVMFQFSFTSDYYKERMRIFIGDEGIEDEEKTIKCMIEFVRKALSK